MGLMQCKNIPDRPILEFLRNLVWTPESAQGFQALIGKPRGATTFEMKTRPANCVLHAMPEGVSEKLARAKMGMLIRRGLVEGCTCGCRGDFQLTDKGREELKC